MDHGLHSYCVFGDGSETLQCLPPSLHSLDIALMHRVTALELMEVLFSPVCRDLKQLSLNLHHLMSEEEFNQGPAPDRLAFQDVEILLC